MLRAELAKAEDALNRAKLQASPAVVVNVERIAKFSRLMQERMENGEIRAKRDYIASIVNTIEVRENIIQIVGQKETLKHAVIAASQQGENVRGFVRNWRARRDSNS